MKKKINILFLLLFVYSCATPEVINIIGPNDSSLNCNELEVKKLLKQMSFLIKLKNKMTAPHNVGALLFYFPGVGVTMKNVDEATKAAQLRAQHLNKLKENVIVNNIWSHFKKMILYYL